MGGDERGGGGCGEGVGGRGFEFELLTYQGAEKLNVGDFQIDRYDYVIPQFSSRFSRFSWSVQ